LLPDHEQVGSYDQDSYRLWPGVISATPGPEPEFGKLEKANVLAQLPQASMAYPRRLSSHLRSDRDGGPRTS